MRRTDGSAVRRFEVHQVDPFLRWLLSLQSDVEVVEPASLREELRKLAATVAHVHERPVS